MNIKLLGIPILILVVCAVLFKHSSLTNTDTTPLPTSMASDQPPITVSAQKLGEAYSLIGGSPDQADKVYLNRNLTVTGTAWLIFKDGTSRMAFKTGGNAVGVMCWFKDEGAAISRVQEGQDVVVNGRCEGLGGDVSMEDCILESVTPLSVPSYHHNNSEHHRMIYKIGEYPRRPEWMSQEQWDSYIDWEAKQ